MTAVHSEFVSDWYPWITKSKNNNSATKWASTISATTPRRQLFNSCCTCRGWVLLERRVDVQHTYTVHFANTCLKQPSLSWWCISLTFSSLLQEEWSVTIRSSHGLCHKGGIAICYKQNLPEVLRRVNYTLQPTAVLLSQEPLTLGLRVATLLKLCMAPFESDSKMDPSRLQSLNDSSANWDSVIQFAWLQRVT